MYPCKKCLENNWTFKKEDDRTITATCTFCGHEVNFSYREKKLELREGAKCRKCSHPIRLRDCKYKESKAKNSYFYTAYFWCDRCRTIYYSDKFKVLNKQYKIDKII